MGYVKVYESKVVFMPYKMEWIIPDRVLYMYTYGHTTVAESEELMDKSFEYIYASGEDSSYLVHVISDSRHVTESDLGINDIRRIFGGQKGRATRPGWTIIITPSPVMRFFGSIALQFMGIRGRQVGTVEDALQILVDAEDDLPSYDELLQAFTQVYGEIQMQVSESQ